MQAAQRHQQLLNDVDDLPFCEAATLCHKLEQITATDILHHDVIFVLALQQLYDLRDIGMVCPFQYFKLAAHQFFVESVLIFRLQVGLIDDLDGARYARFNVSGELHLAEITGAKFLKDLIVLAYVLHDLQFLFLASPHELGNKLVSVSLPALLVRLNYLDNLIRLVDGMRFSLLKYNEFLGTSLAISEAVKIIFFHILGYSQLRPEIGGA